MPEYVAAQEEQLNLPTTWLARLPPRRGRGHVPPVALEPDAPARFRALVQARGDLLERALELGGNRPYRDRINEHLWIDWNPYGAAALGELLRYADPHREPEFRRLELHSWFQEQGLAWTARAFIERCAIHIVGYFEPGREVRFNHLQLSPVDMTSPHAITREIQGTGLLEMRALLAAASDTEYAEAVAAAADHRDTPTKRIIAMLVFPDQAAWVREGCAEYQQERYLLHCDELVWHTASRLDDVKAAGLHKLEEYFLDPSTIAAAVYGLGTDALPFLVKAFESRWDISAENRKALLRGIGLLPADAAADYLLAHLDRPFVLDAAVAAAARFPARMSRRIAAAAPEASGPERARLAAVAAAVDLSRGAPADRAVVEDLLAPEPQVPEADAAEVPGLLVDPPWKTKQPKQKPVVIEGLEPIGEPALVWAPGEQDAWRGNIYDEAEIADWLKDLEHGDDERRHWMLGLLVKHGPAAIADPLLETWIATPDAAFVEYSEHVAQGILARHGLAALDKAVAIATAARGYLTVTGPIRSLGAARFAARRLTGAKAARLAAVAWFDRHGLGAVGFLVPDALGADKQLRDAAHLALGRLALAHGREAVAAEAEPYGPEAAAAIRTLLDVDPFMPQGVKIPKPGTWAAPVLLPQALLKGRKRALPAESVPHLVTVLALATPEYPYPGLDLVAETCDRPSLTRFSHALFEQWIASGGAPKDAWALTQLMHFAEDETVRMLAEKLVEWPGEGQHRRAVAGLEVLGAIGTEAALRAVSKIADDAAFKALKAEATRQINAIAAGLGLDREQLADRLVPEFGLGDKASMVLDYGARTFTVAFNEQLQPYVIDESGKHRKTLPKPGAKDDPEFADAAYARFKTFKRELKAVAAEQVTRLETAMLKGRTWSTEEFRRYFAEHALTGHLARRLVWLAGDTGFRIAEDGSFSDADDEAFALAEDAVVRLAHPAHLGDRLADWAELFADYEILQPFPQLARPVHAFTDRDLATGRLERFEGPTVEVGRLLGMARRGWAKAHPRTGGMCPGIAFPLPGGGFATVALEPGIYIPDPSEYPEQTVRGVYLVATEAYPWHGDPVPDPPEDIDPVAASEILAALTRLAGA
jgi:hypothetical protein